MMLLGVMEFSHPCTLDFEFRRINRDKSRGYQFMLKIYCLKISYILKIIKVLGISSATSSTKNLQKKISARSWMRTKSQELRPIQRFHQCCNSSIKLKKKSNRKMQVEPGSEDNHLRTSPTQRGQSLC